jgi:hypothetical protein
MDYDRCTLSGPQRINKGFPKAALMEGTLKFQPIGRRIIKNEKPEKMKNALPFDLLLTSRQKQFTSRESSLRRKE